MVPSKHNADEGIHLHSTTVVNSNFACCSPVVLHFMLLLIVPYHFCCGVSLVTVDVLHPIVSSQQTHHQRLRQYATHPSSRKNKTTWQATAAPSDALPAPFAGSPAPAVRMGHVAARILVPILPSIPPAVSAAAGSVPLHPALHDGAIGGAAGMNTSNDPIRCRRGLYICHRRCVAASVPRSCGDTCITGPADCADSTCRACTGPRNSSVTCTRGSRAGLLACDFRCKAGFWKSGNVCKPGRAPPPPRTPPPPPPPPPPAQPAAGK
jgi:hypothetical protein